MSVCIRLMGLHEKLRGVELLFKLCVPVSPGRLMDKALAS